MPTPYVVAILMHHNESCSLCYRGEPCAAAERLQDEALNQRLTLHSMDGSKPAVEAAPGRLEYG
jgi:hypothetical protein